MFSLLGDSNLGLGLHVLSSKSQMGSQPAAEEGGVCSHAVW